MGWGEVGGGSLEKGLPGRLSAGVGPRSSSALPVGRLSALSKGSVTSSQTDVALPYLMPSGELASFGIPSEKGIAWPQLPVPTFVFLFGCPARAQGLGMAG